MTIFVWSIISGRSYNHVIMVAFSKKIEVLVHSNVDFWATNTDIMGGAIHLRSASVNRSDWPKISCVNDCACADSEIYLYIYTLNAV